MSETDHQQLREEITELREIKRTVEAMKAALEQRTARVRYLDKKVDDLTESNLKLCKEITNLKKERERINAVRQRLLDSDEIYQ